MKAFFIIFIGLFFGCFSIAQVNYSASVDVGYNRVGIYVNPNVSIHKRCHSLGLGIKTYGYNLFFEKQAIGLTFNYQFTVINITKKVGLSTQLKGSVFKQNNQINNKYLKELIVLNGVHYNLNKNLNLQYKLGLGLISSQSEFNNSKITNDYINYEIGLGLTYRFNSIK